MINEDIEFNASPSSSLNDIVEYRWELGDGNSTIEADPITTHSYTLPSCYVVNLTVEDSIGLTNQTSRCIAVGCGDVNCDSAVKMGDVVKLLYQKEDGA